MFNLFTLLRFNLGSLNIEMVFFLGSDSCLNVWLIDVLAVSGEPIMYVKMQVWDDIFMTTKTRDKEYVFEMYWDT